MSFPRYFLEAIFSSMPKTTQFRGFLLKKCVPIISYQLLNPQFSKMADAIDIDVHECASSPLTIARIFDNFCLSDSKSLHF